MIAAKQRHTLQLFDADQAGANAVFHVMIVVRDLIREIRELRFQAGLLPIDEPLSHIPEQHALL